MAKIIPYMDQSLLDPKNAEHQTLEALDEAFPDEVRIFHNVHYLDKEQRGGRKSTLKEGEIDFLILHPRFGLLLIEVKGGQISQKEKQWYSGQHQIKDPCEQAQHNLHYIENILKTEIGALNFNYGWAVCFPNCVSPPGICLPIEIDRKNLLDQEDITDPPEKLARRIENIIQSWSNGKQGLTAETLNKIIGILAPEFRLISSFQDEKRLTEQQFIKLTQQQTELLIFIQNQPRVCITGPGGSGKTALALEKLRLNKRDGKRTLMLCYTKKLIEHLHNKFPDGKNDITNFHALCEDEARKARIRFPIPADEKEQNDFYCFKAPEILIDALAKTGTKYDSIIVDEAQDFLEDWWIAVEELLIPGGELYVFMDDHQDLFKRHSKAPINLPPLPLTHNCRNSKAINEWMKKNCKYQADTKEGSPTGMPPQIHSWKTEQEQINKITSTLRKLMKEDGYLPKEIVILTPYSDKTSPAVYEIQSQKEFQDIAIHTIMSFKGLESEVVLVCDLGKSSFSKREDLIYTAASRARHRLFVFCNAEFKSHFET